ncbi:carotenoid 1,2-hydratase [candidate division KSB1 bacterium]|nr:carotenoid 1,2-hydratase [candidate division KSB1 bacterium]
MSRFLIMLIIIISIFGLIAFFISQRNNHAEIQARISVADAMSSDDVTGYARAIEPREFRFPQDHGPHNDFRTEWWYFTGNLETADKRQFGFQLTIFRNSLSPEQADRKSDWATNQVYMGHFALTDVDGGEFYAYERFARGAIGIAGVKRNPVQIKIEDWEISLEENKIDIRAAAKESSIDLDMKSEKPIVFHGEKGLSRKGAEPGNASYYYSMTRLASSGIIKINDESFRVAGDAWLDREWSTSALAEDQTGWDWFSLQLDNNAELMYYQIRRMDGTPDRFSKGTLVNADGASVNISKEDVNLQVTGYWESPRGGSYPSGWRLELPRENINLIITPLVRDQELALSFRYWEGAVSVEGTYQGNSVSGKGYVELTGYADQGQWF